MCHKKREIATAEINENKILLAVAVANILIFKSFETFLYVFNYILKRRLCFLLYVNFQSFIENTSNMKIERNI